MRNVPVWIDDTPIRKFPKLQRNINADVLVVGAGVTGLTAAYLLKKAGSNVALIERERVHFNRHRPYNCSPHLCYRRRSPSVGAQFWQGSRPSGLGCGAAAIDEIERIVEGEGDPMRIRARTGLSARTGGRFLEKGSFISQERGRPRCETWI